MAAHTSILAWRIQWTEESDRLWSIESQRGVSLVAQMVKRLPAVRETPGLILGWKDPLEKEMATHFSILAWKIPWTELDTTEAI